MSLNGLRIPMRKGSNLCMSDRNAAGELASNGR